MKVKLKDICVPNGIQTGPFGSQLHQSDYSSTGIPVCMPVNLVEGFISENKIARVSDEHVKRLSRHRLNCGDLIYARRGDIGRSSLVRNKEKGWLCGTGCLKVTPNQNLINPSYLFYLTSLNEVSGWLANHAKGTTMLNLNTEILSELPLEIEPDLQTQRRIAGVLSAYDDLIENNRKQIKLLEEAAQHLYKEWFINFKFPGHEHTPIRDGLPEGWSKEPLSCIVDFKNGYAFKSSQFEDGGKYKIATIKNVQDGYFDTSSASCINELPTNMPSHCILEKGDILLSLTGNVGRVCIVHSDRFLLNQRVAKLDSDYKSFVYCLFRDPVFSSKVKSLANGSAQKISAQLKQVRFP